jgi:SWI/SNF-related matrix-associated actin-dependent regulator 1 of chromatin subfamily A
MNIPAPPGRTFLPYQLAAIRYMMGAPGSLLADEMGLGKTPTAIGVISAMSGERGVSAPPLSVLIVCPAHLVLNWRAELADWLVGDAGCTVISYNGAVKMAEGQTPMFDLLIVDECHYIKRAQTQRCAAVTALAARAHRRIMISGTPFENAPIELWPILQIVAPEAWDPPGYRDIAVSAEQKKTHPGEGYNFWRFANRYCDLKRTRYRQGRYWREAWDFSGGSNLRELQERLRATCMVRRLKSDVLYQLPPKRRQVIVLDVRGCDDGGLLPDMTEENYLATIARLTAEKVFFEAWSATRHAQGLAMVDAVIPHIEDALESTRKRILFCHHRDVAAAYHRAFDAMGLCPVLYTGDSHAADKHAAVKRFQTDADCRLFIGTGAAGTGITLTAAQGVDFAEIDPVPGVMSQREDRAHRVGQRDMVHVRLFVKDNSLSARMARIIVRKQELLTAGLDSTGAAAEPRGRT